MLIHKKKKEKYPLKKNTQREGEREKKRKKCEGFREVSCCGMIGKSPISKYNPFYIHPRLIYFRLTI